MRIGAKRDLSVSSRVCSHIADESPRTSARCATNQPRKLALLLRTPRTSLAELSVHRLGGGEEGGDLPDLQGRARSRTLRAVDGVTRHAACHRGSCLLCHAAGSRPARGSTSSIRKPVTRWSDA
ncbi:hypothetical protein AAFF_G00057130 [Aldrovandia affinis]|uniref:Uncharacterized protein n=1 Tax=Aldrovandia affinis TaxID=143900 RepID=A0AAD7S0S4_9TELE|nr:hypothetical protein AAFF_G00057130 [Aldrovandia affinis]